MPQRRFRSSERAAWATGAAWPQHWPWGAWVSGSGPSFLASNEGGALPIQKDAIVAAADEDTRRTLIYTGKTRERPDNGFHELWEESGLEPLPFPTQVVLASLMVDMFQQAGRSEFIGPFAGQVSGLIHEIQPAAQIVEDLVAEAADIIARRIPALVQTS